MEVSEECLEKSQAELHVMLGTDVLATGSLSEPVGSQEPALSGMGQGLKEGR